MAQLFQLLSKLPSAVHFYLEQSVFPQCTWPCRGQLYLDRALRLSIHFPMKAMFLEGSLLFVEKVGVIMVGWNKVAVEESGLVIRRQNDFINFLFFPPTRSNQLSWECLYNCTRWSRCMIILWMSILRFVKRKSTEIHSCEDQNSDVWDCCLRCGIWADNIALPNLQPCTLLQAQIICTDSYMLKDQRGCMC